MLTFFLVFAAIVAIFHVYTRNNRFGRAINKIQGPFAFPIIGTLYLSCYMTCMHKLWMLMRYLSDKYYPVLRFWYAHLSLVSIRHPDDLEILLTSQKIIEKGYVYSYLHPWLKQGLLTSTGDLWRHRRKMLTPAFHFQILKKYLEIMNEESKKCVEKVKSEDNDVVVVNLFEFSSSHTLNVICESAMGVNLDKMDKSASEKYKRAIHDFGYIACWRMVRPFVRDWMMKPFWEIGRMHTNVIKVLHEFSDKIIKERRAFHKKTDNKYLLELKDLDDDDIWLDRKKKLDMLDILLAAENNNLIDNSGIQEEVDTFTFEGHDTTGKALMFILALFAENEEAQKLARAEVTEVLDKTDGNLSMTDLSSLNYLERCVKEALRLYPPVSTIFRHCTEDIQLKNAFIPGGAGLMINFFDCHRDPNFWSDPEKFDPDRFLPENCMNRHPFAFLPFSAGPRNCIGQRFAMMELKSVVAQILHEFRLEPVDKLSEAKLAADLVLRTLDPIRTKFIRIRK